MIKLYIYHKIEVKLEQKISSVWENVCSLFLNFVNPCFTIRIWFFLWKQIFFPQFNSDDCNTWLIKEVYSSCQPCVEYHSMRIYMFGIAPHNWTRKCDFPPSIGISWEMCTSTTKGWIQGHTPFPNLSFLQNLPNSYTMNSFITKLESALLLS